MLDIPIEDLISALVIIIAISLFLVIGIKSQGQYRKNKEALPLIIAFASFFISLAMFILLIEKVLLIDTLPLYNENMGILAGAIATTVSGFAAVTFDLFAFKMVFPKRTVILTAIAAVYASIYVIHWWIDPTKHVVEGEIEFLPLYGIAYPFTPLLSYIILVPLMSIPIFILLYYALKVRSESSLKSKRAAILGLGGVALATAYTTELLGLDLLTTTIFRILFVVAAILFYIALFKLKAKE